MMPPIIQRKLAAYSGNTRYREMIDQAVRDALGVQAFHEFADLFSVPDEERERLLRYFVIAAWPAPFFEMGSYRPAEVLAEVAGDFPTTQWFAALQEAMQDFWVDVNAEGFVHRLDDEGRFAATGLAGVAETIAISWKKIEEIVLQAQHESRKEEAVPIVPGTAVGVNHVPLSIGAVPLCIFSWN